VPAVPETIVIDRRFRGPTTSANGGYAAGVLAQHVEAPAVEVTLRLPPPLERPLRVRLSDDGMLLLDADDLVAEAHSAELELEPPRVTSAEAKAGARCHVRLGNEVFRECFSCGVRPEGDGLEIHAGPVPGRDGVHAALWTAHEATEPVVWAAIDCVGAYAVGAPGRGDSVLGRMTARIDRLPDLGERCVVVGWPLGEDGRKLFAGTALLGEDGEPLAVARQVWIVPLSRLDGGGSRRAKPASASA
jgi:hypothetical protein